MRRQPAEAGLNLLAGVLSDPRSAASVLHEPEPDTNVRVGVLAGRGTTPEKEAQPCASAFSP